MHRKRLVGLIGATIALLLSAVLVGGLLLHTIGTTGVSQVRTLPGKPSPSASTQGTTHTTPITIPRITSATGSRLSVPSVGINAPIENVGVAKDGSLAVPAQQPWTDVGWYDHGPYPGTRGSAVIDGHLNRPGGCCIPAVFWTLSNMHIGDIVTVTSAKGQAWHFRTVGIKTLQNNAPTSTIFGRSDGTYLNLITCAGSWIPSQHQTTLRLVVYTVLV